MARIDRRRVKSSKPNARAANRSSSAVIDDTMFFPRLRRHAKWMFVFLALVFGVGFVVFGVGAGGTGIGDIFRGGGGGNGAPSISEAKRATEKNQYDAAAWRDLANAYQTDGNTDGAIVALRSYVALKPKDGDSLRELASLYLAQGTAKRQEAQAVQFEGVYGGGSTAFAPTLGGNALQNPFAQAIDAGVTGRLNTLLAASGTAFGRAVLTYKKLAATAPTDPNIQLELAQAAEQAGDTATAIAAYQKFLRLAPDDPSAPIVKQQLKQLKSASTQPSG